ncbi:hypothetical protein M1627_2900 [Sulfolobus islandicus M.16.27]|uniref:Uncharacterized protein n=1 Tax=Saccharolobus islandicus (strain M.16.27) TaxID=427318 RepID=C3N3S4_SACI3|nr:hypothetical protein M1627_2900 [Sulfolobus islandicus M.16.27]
MRCRYKLRMCQKLEKVERTLLKLRKGLMEKEEQKGKI